MADDPLDTLDPDLVSRLRRLRLLALDVDGVLTDGRMTYAASGWSSNWARMESKSFHVHDGLGLSLLLKTPVEVALLSARKSAVVRWRARDLGIRHVVQDARDKGAALRGLAKRLRTDLTAVAYMGDDLHDLPALMLAGVAFAPHDARPEVREEADYVTSRRAGRGAVREVVELIMRAQGTWQAAIDRYRGQAK